MHQYIRYFPYHLVFTKVSGGNMRYSKGIFIGADLTHVFRGYSASAVKRHGYGTWSLTRLKSPETRMFVLQHVQTNRKGNIKLRMIDSLREESIGDQKLPLKRQVMRKRFSCYNLISKPARRRRNKASKRTKLINLPLSISRPISHMEM